MVKMNETTNKKFASQRSKFFDEDKRNMLKICEHAFWIEDLNKEGYNCACYNKMLGKPRILLNENGKENLNI